MARLSEVTKNDYLSTVAKRIPQCASQLKQVRQSLEDVNANWLGYASREQDAELLQANGGDFVALVTGVWEGGAKDDLVAALDVLAGGMGVSRTDVLEQLGE